MSLSSVRPDAHELVFHLFGRSVHPELLDVRAEAEIWHEGYSASLQLCDSGHVVSLRVRGETVTEVTSARRHPLPFTFPTVGRFDPAPLSLFTTDSWPDSLLVNAFHTFPENGAVVKTQSLFEL